MKTGWKARIPWAGSLLGIAAAGFFVFNIWEGFSRSGLGLGTGSFSVSTIPSGATVHWKGSELGNTPLRQCSLPVGDQVIELTAPGFQNYPVELSVKPGSRIDLGVLILARQLGKIRFVTDPAGIAFQVQGPDRKMISGTTPATIENLPFGKYEVTLSEPGWPSYTQTVELMGTDPIQVSRPFRGAQVALTSDPPGAVIFVDGSKMGNTPVTANLPIGPIQVTSRFGSLVPVAQTLTLDPERVVSFHFKHSYGTLTVNSDRTDAALIVDGTDYGHPPAQLFLSPGSHKILLTAPNAPDKTRRVDLPEGERVAVQILFGGATTETVSTETLDAPPAPAKSAPRPPAIAVVAPAATKSERELSPIPPAPPIPAPTVTAGVELGSPSSVDALRPVIPEASLEAPPTPALPENRLKSSRSQAVSLLAIKKNSLAPSNANPTPALKPEQATSKEEAYRLFNLEWKQMESELEAEKKNIELQIKSSSGALREGWKYRLVQWRLKKAQAERDGAAAKAKLKEQWK